MIKENDFKIKGFLVWGICAFFFLYEFFLRTVIGSFQHPLMQDLNLSTFQFSLLSTTLFFVIYGLMQIPAGVIVDNIGLKKSLLLGALVCTFSSIGFAYAYSYPAAVLYRMLMAFGASFGFICLLMSVHDWMPHRFSAIFIGLSQFIGTIGPMAAAGPLHTLTESSGVHWRDIFLVLGGVGVVIFFLSLLFVSNNQERTGQYIVLHRPEKIATSIKRLFMRIQPWYIAFLSATLYFTIEYLSENEGRMFLSLKGIGLGQASYMITLSWLGYAIGCPLLGFISDMIHRRKIVMMTAAVFSLLGVSMILYAERIHFLMLAFVLLGLGASGQSIGFATMAEQFKKQFVAVGFGLNNAVITLLSALNAPLIGLLLDHNRQGTEITLENYLFAFTVLLVTVVIAVILSFFFVRETYAKSVADFTYLKPRSQ